MDHDARDGIGGGEVDGEVPAAPEDTKARFRAALERKQQQRRRGQEGLRNTGAVHGPEVTGGRRQYRRKTG